MLSRLLLVLTALTSTLFAVGQNPTPPSDFVLIESVQGWCSVEGQYSTAELTDQPVNTCAKKALKYGKWFKFEATSEFLEINLNLGGQKGSMHFPYISVWDGTMKQLDCKAYEDELTPLTLIQTKLTPGQPYYILVNNHTHSSYVGSFTLCVNDVPSYDFFEGAIELTETNKWCSPEGAYTTIGASADQKKPACLTTQGPNFNRWFKFTAESNEINVTVKGADDGFDFPFVGLFDNQLRTVGCAKYVDEQTPITVTYKRLQVGQTYYISVDHQYNINYRGAFSLCLDDGRARQLRGKLVSVSGRLFYLDTRKATGLVQLQTDKGVTVHSTQTDAAGKFEFNNLNARETFMLKVDEVDDDVMVDAYQTAPDGAIVGKAVKQEANLYAFEDPDPALNYVSLVTPESFSISIEKGHHGLVGKVVQKSAPANGIANVGVDVYDTGRRKLQSTKTDAAGKFMFNNLPADQSVLVKLEEANPDHYVEMLILDDAKMPVEAATSNDMDAQGYFHFRKLAPIITEINAMNAEDVVAVLPTDFSNLSAGREITLNNLYFEPARYTLLDKSYVELGKLATLLKEKSGMRIEIAGHTDNTGDEAANKKLSEDRARVVVNYLVQSGIRKDRLSFKGFGSSTPMRSNATASGRQANRRVSFTVLSE